MGQIRRRGAGVSTGRNYWLDPDDGLGMDRM